MLMQQFGVQGIPAVFAVRRRAGPAALPGRRRRGADPRDPRPARRRSPSSASASPASRSTRTPSPGPRPPRPQAPGRTVRRCCSKPPCRRLDAGDLGGAVQAYKNVLSRRPGQHRGQTRPGPGRVAPAGAGRRPAAGAQGRRREAAGRAGADRRGRPGSGRRPCRGRVRAAHRDRAAHGGRRPGRRTACGCWSCSRSSARTTRGWSAARRALARALF